MSKQVANILVCLLFDSSKCSCVLFSVQSCYFKCCSIFQSCSCSCFVFRGRSAVQFFSNVHVCFVLRHVQVLYLIIFMSVLYCVKINFCIGYVCFVLLHRIVVLFFVFVMSALCSVMFIFCI